jgi:hypothetical protein
MIGSALAVALAITGLPGPDYAPDERMEYGISYLGMRVGIATISVGRGEGPLLPVRLDARSTGLADGLFNIREKLVSYLDPATGLPATSTIEAVEGHHRHTETTLFDREAGKAVVRRVGKTDKTKEIEVAPGTLDFVAMVFRLRSLPLDEGSRHEFDVLAGTKVARVIAVVAGREKIKTGAGKLPAVKIRVPTGLSRKFSERDPTYVWLSDDARRIVLRISTDLPVGRAVATLSGYRPGELASAVPVAVGEGDASGPARRGAPP